MNDIMWTLEDAAMLTSAIRAVLLAHGTCIGLTGSVLNVWYSTHDLDLFFYPFDSTKPIDLRTLRETLYDMDFRLTHTHDKMHAHWRSKGSMDEKIVEVYDYGGRRIDAIIMGVNAMICGGG